MAEYINKAEVLKEIARFSTNEGSNTVCSKLYCDMGLMPTIEIIHCSECKHYEKYTENTGLCNHCVVNGERFDMEYDWFCADGERKE